MKPSFLGSAEISGELDLQQMMCCCELAVVEELDVAAARPARC
jgi:hypothetical protein